MNQRQRSITTTVVVVLALTAVGVWWVARKVSEGNSAAKKEEIRAEHAERAKRELRTVVENMATRYNAMTNWVNLFGEQHSGGVFTIEVEEVLRPTNGQPVLVVGYLNDLAKRNGKYYVYIYSLEGQEIYYILECDGDQANSIKKHGRYFAKVAVVVSIDAVKKPDLEARAEALAVDEAEINIAPAESPYVARGRCLDLLFVTAGYRE